ncbi:MAG: carboxypeptidase-like regulatory domain-containing protein, partial [Terriglobales bacterium]
MAGTITDPSHAAVPGATVKVMGISTGIQLTATTGSQGHFSIANVQPGSYLITVSKTGFKTGTFQNVTVAAQAAYTLDATLQVGSQSSTVTVEAGESVLQTQQTSVGTNIVGKVITNLPTASANN